MKQWTTNEMQRVLQLAEPYARKAGYIIAVSGSVPRSGSGRDLDLIAIPYEQHVSRDQFVRGFCKAIKEHVCIGTRSENLFDRFAGCHISWGVDLWIDLTFTENPGAAKSLDLSHP